MRGTQPTKDNNEICRTYSRNRPRDIGHNSDSRAIIACIINCWSNTTCRQDIWTYTTN